MIYPFLSLYKYPPKSPGFQKEFFSTFFFLSFFFSFSLFFFLLLLLYHSFSLSLPPYLHFIPSFFFFCSQAIFFLSMTSRDSFDELSLTNSSASPPCYPDSPLLPPPPVRCESPCLLTIPLGSAPNIFMPSSPNYVLESVISPSFESSKFI